MDGVVPTGVGTNAVGGARVSRQSGKGVVLTLTVGVANGGDRGQVEHVKAHGGNAVQLLGGGS